MDVNRRLVNPSIDGATGHRSGPKRRRRAALLILGPLLIVLLLLAGGSTPAFGTLTAIQRAKLTAIDGDRGDFFGRAVSLSGATALVGAWTDDEVGLDAGAAYVMVDDGSGTWSQQAKLTASDSAALDRFGSAVSLDGDTAVVGAPGHDDNGLLTTGAAYIFVRNAEGIWMKQARLTASNAADHDAFGRAVSISGDSVLVGAPQKSSDGKLLGAAYVFVRDDQGNWSEQAKFDAPEPSRDIYFGFSVALDGDAAAVGSVSHSEGGAAYVFGRSGASWSQQAKLTASDTTPRKQFGEAVSIDDNLIVVGAPGDNLAAFSSGAAYVFEQGPPGTWVQKVKLTAADVTRSDEFGWSVSLHGTTALVGAPGHRDAGERSGAAYVFAPDTAGVWSQQAKLVAADAGAGDGFGNSVSLNGATALIGAPEDDSARDPDIGAAYLFSLEPGGTPVSVLLDNLRDELESLDFQRAIKRMLQRHLELAAGILEDDNPYNDRAAGWVLENFISITKVFSGRWIPQEDAAKLIDGARAVIAALPSQ